MNRLGLAFADTGPSGDKAVDIHITTIPHAGQPYATVGFWKFDEADGGPTMRVTVSHLIDADYEFLVGLHEMIEAYLCRKAGISERIVTAFDELFDAERAGGKHDETAEPGDDRRAPYAKEHKFATKIERLVARQLGVKWDEYEAAITALDSKAS